MEDKDLLGLLRAAIGRGDIEVQLDIRRQHHVDSPLYRVSDSSWIVYAMMVVVAATTYFLGWTACLVAFATMVLIYMLVVRRWVAKLMRRRLLTEVLVNPDDFRKAWKLKGIGFRHMPTGTRCESPDGLWRGFIIEACKADGGTLQPTT